MALLGRSLQAIRGGAHGQHVAALKQCASRSCVAATAADGPTQQQANDLDLHFSFQEGRIVEEKHQAEVPGVYLSADIITGYYRAEMVDRMVRACDQLNLRTASLHRGVALLDRCQWRLQLGEPDHEQASRLACACLWVAAKYEELVVPKGRFFLEAMQQAPGTMLHEVECQVLEALDFNVSAYPTAADFMKLILMSCSSCCPAMPIYCAHYLVEMSLLEDKLLTTPASEVAAAAFACALKLTGLLSNACAAHVSRITGYTMDELKPTMHVLLVRHTIMYDNGRSKSPLRYATVERFSRMAFAQVAVVVEPAKLADYCF